MFEGPSPSELYHSTLDEVCATSDQHDQPPSVQLGLSCRLSLSEDGEGLFP